ncbi:MAG TPA: hypothetical protein PK280_00220 [Planctomycetota bacterium]|nr:hypothetical protein [Planctomycetota bacterium]
MSKAMLAAAMGVVLAFGPAGGGAGAGLAAAAEPSSPAAVEPAQAADPAVTAILEKLGDNSSALLPATKVIGDPGPLTKQYGMDKRGPGGRDYSIKMAWMPDRKRAFFCGANHGTPHRLNDAWEYDLPSNSWIVLYAADYNDRGAVGDYDKKTLEVRDGWLRTKLGGPGHPAHTWWEMTYDPEMKAAVWLCQWPPYRLKEKLDAIGATQDQFYKGPPMWAFYPWKKQWEPLPTKEPWPRTRYASSLEYVPDVKGSLWTSQERGIWILDSKTLAWKEVSKGKPADRPGDESVVCYDSSRKLLIAHRSAYKAGGACCTWQMATAGDALGEWKKVVEKPDLPEGFDARSMFYFDPVGRVGLLYDTTARAIWAYDPDKTEWTRLKPEGAPIPEKGDARPVGYFDPERNVFVVNMGTVTWVYRYKKAAEKK